jgi:hypothetical protein
VELLLRVLGPDWGCVKRSELRPFTLCNKRSAARESVCLTVFCGLSLMLMHRPVEFAKFKPAIRLIEKKFAHEAVEGAQPVNKVNRYRCLGRRVSW